MARHNLERESVERSGERTMRWVGGGGLSKKDAWVELQTLIEKGFVTTGESVIEAVEAWVVATGERRRERTRT